MAMAFVVALLFGSAGASGETVVPVEGPWHATTSAGLPVGFQVGSGQVVDPRWRFKVGLLRQLRKRHVCGLAGELRRLLEIHRSARPLDRRHLRDAHPARRDGDGAEQDAPRVPETHATFVAGPGAASFDQQPVVVLANVVTRRLAIAPRGMVLRRDGSLRFYRLDWQKFGEGVTRATGRAFLRHGCRRCRDRVVRRPRVVVYLNELT